MMSSECTLVILLDVKTQVQKGLYWDKLSSDNHYQNSTLQHWSVQIIIPNWFSWLNEIWDTDNKKPLPKTTCLWICVYFFISILQYIIVLGETYKFQTKNIIVYKVSTNICPLFMNIILRKLTYKFEKTKIYLMLLWQVS